MTASEPGHPLSLEQWRHVEILSQSLNPVQALHLSGYFAGLDVGLRHPLPEPASNITASHMLTILYGTETGNAAELARTLESAVKERGLTCTLTDMADYKTRQIAQEQDMLVIVSTYGEGDPPQPATGFFEFIESRKPPRLENKRFAVLALGDSTYEYYCQAGKRIDERLEALGAERLTARIDCDVDYDEQAQIWITAIVDQLAGEAQRVSHSHAAAALKTSEPTLTVHDKRHPFRAEIIENIPIVGRGSSKETRHLEFSLKGSGLAYEPGDALGIFASNDSVLATNLLQALGLPADSDVDLKGQRLSLGEALIHRVETTLATPRFLDYWAMLSEADALHQLRQDDRAGERSVFLRTHHIIDIIRRFPVQGAIAQEFVSALRPLQPRLYSLASSPLAYPDEAHLTLSPLRYNLHDEARSGVASAMLADRSEPGDVLPIYIQTNPHFRLPRDGGPIIMIGAGTGIAPFRSFLQEREARGSGGKSWLFFGERHFRTNFLYQTEWQSWLKDGVLSRMDVAFSRDGADKIYVQHRMKEQARDIFAWLEEGAHVYVCGDATHLAPDVHQMLIDIVANQSRTGHEAAEDYVRSLQADHRYQRDVY